MSRRFSLNSELHNHSLVTVIGGEEEHFEDFGESNTSELLLESSVEGTEGEADSSLVQPLEQVNGSSLLSPRYELVWTSQSLFNWCELIIIQVAPGCQITFFFYEPLLIKGVRHCYILSCIVQAQMPLCTFFRENVFLMTKTPRSNSDKSYLETSFTALSDEGQDKCSEYKVQSGRLN